MPLNGKQKRRLRALGHHLSVVVQVGANGVTEGVIAAASQALKDHELIKVKIADDRDGRVDAIASLAKGTGAEIAQTLGRTVLLFKKRSKKSKFEALFSKTVEAAPVVLEADDDSDDLPVDFAAGAGGDAEDPGDFPGAEIEVEESRAPEVEPDALPAPRAKKPQAKKATAKSPAAKKPATTKAPAKKKPAARKSTR